MDTEYEYFEYPKLLYKAGSEPHISGWVPPAPCLSREVANEEEELKALEEGWSTTPPKAEEKSAEKPVLKAKVAA